MYLIRGSGYYKYLSLPLCHMHSGAYIVLKALGHDYTWHTVLLGNYFLSIFLYMKMAMVCIHQRQWLLQKFSSTTLLYIFGSIIYLV